VRRQSCHPLMTPVSKEGVGNGLHAPLYTVPKREKTRFKGEKEEGTSPLALGPKIRGRERKGAKERKKNKERRERSPPSVLGGGMVAPGGTVS